MTHDPAECENCGESVMPIGVEKRCPLCGHEHRGGGRIRTTRVTFIQEDTTGKVPDNPSWSAFSSDIDVINTGSTSTDDYDFTLF